MISRNLVTLALVMLSGMHVTEAAAVATAAATSFSLLAGGYTNVITTLKFDAVAKTVSVVGSCPSGDNPSWVTTHPSDPYTHYAGNELENGLLTSFSTKSANRICSALQTTSAQGWSPDHVAVIRGGKEIMSVNYVTGDGVSYTLTPDRTGFTNPQKIPAFSNISHPHQVVEYGSEVFVPDLGTDKIWRLAKTNTGGWSTRGFIPQPAGSGPRHIAIRGSTVFTLHELSNTLIAQGIPYSAASNTTTTISSVSVLPPNVTTTEPGRYHAAELILSPCGGFLYASDRDTSTTAPDPRGDPIVIVSVSNTSALKVVKYVFTGLQVLRGLAQSPDGRYLIAGGQENGGVVVYEVINGGADLQEVARNRSAPKSTTFVWLRG